MNMLYVFSLQHWESLKERSEIHRSPKLTATSSYLAVLYKNKKTKKRMRVQTPMKAACSDKINFTVATSALRRVARSPPLMKECRRSRGTGEEENKRVARGRRDRDDR